MKNNKRKLISLALAAALLLGGCGQGGDSKTYMTVNGQSVSQGEFDRQLDLYKTLMAAQYGLSDSIKYSLIRQEVMLQDLEKNGVEITKEDYAVEYDQAVNQYGGASQYGAALKQLGVSDDQMKESLRLETVARKHREWYDSQNTPSEEELQKEFEAHKDQYIQADASHILVNTEDEAKAALKRIQDGEKFEDVAKEVSTDGSAAQGGALGVSPVSKYDPDFTKALMALSDGEMSSEPVKTQFGYHIIRMNKKMDSYEANKDAIVSAVLEDKYKDYVTSLVDGAEVKVSGEEESKESSEAEESQEDAQTESQDGGEESPASEESKAN